MRIMTRAILPFILASYGSQAFAAPKVLIQPIQMTDEFIRYSQGMATVDQFSENGSVQVRPLGLDHGSLAFSIAVFNDSRQSVNIDVTNFTLSQNGVTVPAFTVEALEKKAKSRAAWAQVGLALAGGISAAAAASQRDTYHGSFHTPRGTYHSYYSAPSVAGQMQATAIAAGTGVGIATIQNRLDQTLSNLGNDIVQLSTVDPGQSYAGKIVFQKVKLAVLPLQVVMTVDWNGRHYPFRFQVVKPGTPAPEYKPSTINQDVSPRIIIEIPTPTDGESVSASVSHGAKVENTAALETVALVQ